MIGLGQFDEATVMAKQRELQKLRAEREALEDEVDALRVELSKPQPQPEKVRQASPEVTRLPVVQQQHIPQQQGPIVVPQASASQFGLLAAGAVALGAFLYFRSRK